MIRLVSEMLMHQVQVPYNNPAHGNPHGPSSTKVIAKDKVQDTTGETAQVVDTDDDPHQAVTWVINLVQEVVILDDATEDALVIA